MSASERVRAISFQRSKKRYSFAQVVLDARVFSSFKNCVAHRRVTRVLFPRRVRAPIVAPRRRRRSSIALIHDAMRLQIGKLIITILM